MSAMIGGKKNKQLKRPKNCRRAPNHLEVREACFREACFLEHDKEGWDG